MLVKYYELIYKKLNPLRFLIVEYKLLVKYDFGIAKKVKILKFRDLNELRLKLK